MDFIRSSSCRTLISAFGLSSRVQPLQKGDLHSDLLFSPSIALALLFAFASAEAREPLG